MFSFPGNVFKLYSAAEYDYTKYWFFPTNKSLHFKVW